MTGYEIPGQCLSFKAKVAIPIADKYKPVVVDSNDTIRIATDADTSPVVIGVVQNEAKAGEPVRVMIDGVTFYKATAAITAGATVSVGAASNKTVFGVALQTAAIGDVIPLLIQ